MFGYEITQILSRDPVLYKNFLGFIPVESIPRKLPCHKFLILNVSNHWICLHRTVFGTYEVFDSLGNTSKTINIIKCFQNLKRSITYTTTPLQSSESTSCGNFVIFFIYHRFYDDDTGFEEFLNTYFSKQTCKNENKVKRFITKFQAKHGI